MNCFMSYNPNVAKEVKITTWIKEFDGASPVYPSFPNDGDVFIVFDTDEAKEPSVNKTYTSGEWADTSSGGGGGGDFTTATVTFTNGKGEIRGCFVDEDGDMSTCEMQIANEGGSATVIMYKGSAYIYIGEYEATVSGNIEDDGDGYYIVTGNATITYS